MATRAKIHVARREEGVSFSEIPEKVMVSIYNHYDGYPEGLGVTLASYLDDYKITCLLYTSPSPRDRTRSRMPSSA